MQARSRLYARRAKGDLDLGLEPALIDSQGNRHWSKIDTPGGLLPGGTYQDIHEYSLTQNYRVGTRRVEDSRVFHYCYAPLEPVCGGFPNSQIGAFTNSQLIYVGDGAQPDVAEGATYIDMTLNAGVDVAAHALQEGFFAGFGQRAFYRISDNDAASAPGGTVRIYLKRPVWNAFGASYAGDNTYYAYPNIYQNTVWPDPAWGPGNFGYATVVCVPIINPVLYSWYWGQTWGPMPLINGLWGYDVGARANEREFHFDWMGRICHRGAILVDAHMQRGGYCLYDGRLGGGQMVFLQLDP